MRSMKILFIVAASLILVGGILFVIIGFLFNWNFKSMLGRNYVSSTTELTEDFDAIEIYTDTVDISFVLSETEERKAVSYDRKEISYTFRVEGGILKVGFLDSRSWFEKFFNISLENSLTLYLTKSEFASLKIEEHTGNITVPSGFSFGNIDLKLTTGDLFLSASADEKITVNGNTGRVNLDSLAANEVDVSTSTGDVSVTGLTASGEVRIGVSTGAVKLKNSTLGGLRVTGTTGSVTVEDTTAKGASVTGSTGDVDMNKLRCEGLEVKVSTGDVRMKDIHCADLYLKVSTGSAELRAIRCGSITSEGSTGDLKLTDVISEGKFDLKRDTGSVSFEVADAKEIFVRTDTGDVRGSLLSDKVYIIETDTGRVDVPRTVTGGRCEITTDTGDVIITVK